MIGEQNHVLWIERGDGAAVAHRVIPSGAVRLAVVNDRRQRAVPVRVVGHGDERLVPASELVPAAPLNALEEDEYQALDQQLAGTIGEAVALKRFNGLRLRSLMFGSAE
jgi:hypothetical protein